MKRSAGDKPMDVIEISDDDSPSKQPPQKTMKKGEEQFASQPFLDMHQSLVKLDKDYQHACRVAEEAQKRVNFLENLLDKKPNVSEDTEKEELKKRLTEVSAKLEEATRKNGEMIKKNCERTHEIVAHKLNIEGLKKTIASMHTDRQLLDRANLLTLQLSEQLQKANENTAKDLERIDELSRKLSWFEGTTQQRLQLQLQSKNKLIEDLQKKFVTELEEVKRETAKRDEQLTKFEKDYQSVCRNANEYEIDLYIAKARVYELESKSSVIAPVVGEGCVVGAPVVGPVVGDDTEKNLVAELGAKLAETSTLLKKERSEGAIREKRLKESVRSLTQRLDAVEEEQARAREKKSDTEGRLKQAHIGSGLSFPLMPTRPPPVLFAPQFAKKPPVTSPNLCEPCNWGDKLGAVPFLSALDQLRSKYHPTDDEWMRKCKNTLSDETHICTICNKVLPSEAILTHFFSKGHRYELHARNAGMPFATFDYWMAKLDSISMPDFRAFNGAVTPTVDVSVKAQPIPRPAVDPLVAPKVTVTPSSHSHCSYRDPRGGRNSEAHS